MIGANVALFWFAIVGMFGAIANSIQTGVFDPNTSDPSSIVANLGLGWVAFGVLILATCTTNCVNFFVVHKRNYDWSQSATVGGKYWYTNGINWIAVCTWLIGVAVYFLCLRLDFVMNTLGAIYATVLVTAVVYWVANLIFNKNYQKKAA